MLFLSCKCDVVVDHRLTMNPWPMLLFDLPVLADFFLKKGKSFDRERKELMDGLTLIVHLVWWAVQFFTVSLVPWWFLCVGSMYFLVVSLVAMEAIQEWYQLIWFGDSLNCFPPRFWPFRKLARSCKVNRYFSHDSCNYVAGTLGLSGCGGVIWNFKTSILVHSFSVFSLLNQYQV